MIPNQQDVIRLSLKASQTLVIPTAWIHAVYTPTDSVVLGGNFLHGLDIPTQLQVHCIESRTRVQEKFRFPFLLPLNFSAGGMYLEKLRWGTIAKREVDGLGELIDALDQWWKVQKGQSQLQTGPTVVRAAEAGAKKNQCSTVEEFLSELRKEHKRVVEHGISPNPNFTPPSSPSSKPKLRLKLKGVVVPSAPVMGDKFRIIVSSSALKLNAPLPQSTKTTKRVREDTEWYDTGPAMDDDWMPSGKQKKRASVTAKPRSSSQPQRQQPNSDTSNNPRAKATGSVPPKKTMTSRQRLMKRFR
jgi:hypothetical protein